MPEELIILIQSLLEVLLFVIIIYIINANTRLGLVQTIVYIIALAVLSTLIDVFQLQYHMVFSIAASIALFLLLKRPYRAYIWIYIIDLLIGFVLLSLVQMPFIAIAELLSIDILDSTLAPILILVGLIVLLGWLSSKQRTHLVLEKYYAPYRMVIVFAIITFLFLVIILGNITNYYNDLLTTSGGAQVFLVVIGYFIVNLLLGISLFRLMKTAAENNNVIEYGEHLESIINSYRASNHDIKNHLQIIIDLNTTDEGAVVNQELDDYVQALISGGKQIGEISMIKDDVLISAMLHQKQQYAKQQYIQFFVNIKSSLLIYKIPHPELMDILINLINNAFEEVETLSPENRLVILDFDDQLIEIRNKISLTTLNEGVDHFFDKEFSTKGSDRGFGLYNVLRTSERYHIVVNSEILDDEFVFKMIFPE